MTITEIQPTTQLKKCQIVAAVQVFHKRLSRVILEMVRNPI